MFKFRYIILMLSLTLITGCQSAKTATALPPSATSPPATPTQVLPTHTLLPPTPTTHPSPLSDTPQGLIAYASDQSGDFEIWVVKADGSDPRNLTENRAMDLSPAWSPDGSQIAFVSDRDGNDEIYLMDADGGDPQRLTQTEDASESFPAWSPDGSQISFDSDRDGNWEIYVMGADGSDPRRLTDHPAEDWISSWSPDGRQMVFESGRDGNYEIYRMASSGGELQRLTENQVHDGFPAWSPGGGRIAYMSQQQGNYDIYLMNPDGTDLRQVTQDPAQDSDPGWSPDGEWLVFVSQREGNDEIYLVRADGSDLRQLTSNGAQNWTPAWQPTEKTVESSNTWIRTFEGPEYGAFFDLTLTGDGNLLAVGTTNHLHFPPYSGDALLVKLTLEGEVLWERTWGGEGYEQAWSVLPAGDGGFFVFGETDSYGAGGRDFFLLKIDENGDETWYQTYGRAFREWPYGMVRLSNGDLLVHGFSEGAEGGGREQYVLRLGSGGEVLWEYRRESGEEEIVIDALETGEGDLILLVIAGEDSKLAKLDPNGDLQWEVRYELEGWQFASQVVQTGDGGYLLAGFSMSSAAPRQADTWLAQVTSTGELVWETAFGNEAFDDYAQSMIQLEDGTYLIGGLGNGMLLTRIDAGGNILWQRSLVGQRVYGAKALIQLEDGGFLVAGFLQISNGRSYDAILLRTDPEGQVGE